jgi:hypothetical protein
VYFFELSIVNSESTTLKKGWVKPAFFKSEPCVPQVEPQELFESLIKTYEKLKELGFTYYNGKVSVIESKEEDSNV